MRGEKAKTPTDDVFVETRPAVKMNAEGMERRARVLVDDTILIVSIAVAAAQLASRKSGPRSGNGRVQWSGRCWAHCAGCLCAHCGKAGPDQLTATERVTVL